MLASGFTSAPVSRLLFFGLIASSIVVSIADTKHLFHIQIVPHLWRYKQFWRLLTWQTCYTNSTELLFASMTLYHLRTIERLWGSRKFASFLLLTLPPTLLLPPLLLTILTPLSPHTLTTLPAGPTPLLFALLAQYHASIPQTYKYRLVTSSTTTSSSSSSPSSSSSSSSSGILLTDKSPLYLLSAQLALTALPGSVVGAAVGWAVGVAWRGEWGPKGWGRWRVPGWVVGEGGRGRGEGFEGLRRRMESQGGEGGRGSGSGVDGGVDGEGRRRVGFGEGFGRVD